jgi:hypothetical protein
MRRAHPNLWSLNWITLVTKKLMRLTTFSHRRAPPPPAKAGIALVCKSGSPQGPDGSAPRVNNTMLRRMPQQGGLGPASSGSQGGQGPATA